MLAWLEGGANAELLRISNAREPTLSVDEFARSLIVEPPSEGRVRAIVDFAESQGAGDFFVLVEEALSEAAHTVWAELDGGAPAFQPMSGDELFGRLEASFDAAVVSFLYRFETVPEDVLRSATLEYSSAAGRWYVETYALGIARAIRAAGDRVVTALRS